MLANGLLGNMVFCFDGNSYRERSANGTHFHTLVGKNLRCVIFLSFFVKIKNAKEAVFSHRQKGKNLY